MTDVQHTPEGAPIGEDLAYHAALAERDRLKVVNAELLDTLKNGVKAAERIDRAHDIISGTAAERALYDWANQAHTAIAKAKLP